MLKDTYEITKKRYAEFGVDTEKVIEKLKNITFSIHGWQADDFSGFEKQDSALCGGGLLSTGNYPGKARNITEYRRDMEKVFSLIPGKKKLNFHTIYGDFKGKFYDRDAIRPEHFDSWIDWAKENKIGIDINPVLWSHELASYGYTISHTDEKIRNFWIEHVKRTRAIGAYIGKNLNQVCICDIWIPDGSKDYTVSKFLHRKILKESLDDIFSVEYPENHLLDALESKLFGVAFEAYTVGSQEFYLSYAIKNNKIILYDTGHMHPEEYVSDKISAILQFVRGIMFHLSRGMRWDSDHVTLFSDEIVAIMQEIVRADALNKVYIGTEFFDASINRIGAYTTGIRAVQKALLYALLEPVDVLRDYENKNQLFARLGLFENLKSMPYGDIWNHYCSIMGVADDSKWISEVFKYENEILSKRV
ncbi:MAG: L-rhamnose isomerase [Actinobacteria bacterium]|nr:L-rhamnose isomerase [Actinomycetota bacterium]